MQRTVFIGAVTVGLLAGCGGGSSTPAVPTTSPTPTSANAESGDTSPTTAAQGAISSGQFAKYAPVICGAIAETLAALTPQNVPEVYRARLVTTLADGRIPLTQLADAAVDPAVVATCPSDYKTFLERAGMTDLSNL
jgi:hypothetical protein